MRIGFVAVIGLFLVVSGCASPQNESTNPVGADPEPDPRPPIHFEGAEADSEWYARTFLSIGTDNRPNAGEWHASDKTSRSGDRSWTFQDETVGRYHDAATFDLHSPTLDVSDLAQPTLRFFYRGESELRSGDEFSWGLLVRGNLDAFGSTDGPAPDWTEVTLDLKGRGPSIDILFRFDADGCGGDTPAGELCGEGTFEGYFIDDIEVYDATTAPSP